MAQLLRLASLLCCAFVLVSFLLFAVAQTSSASKGQADAIANGQVSGKDTDNLNSPWNGVIATTNKWVKHLIPTAISLLVYGFLVGFIVRWAAGRPA